MRLENQIIDECYGLLVSAFNTFFCTYNSMLGQHFPRIGKCRDKAAFEDEVTNLFYMYQREAVVSIFTYIEKTLAKKASTDGFSYKYSCELIDKYLNNNKEKYNELRQVRNHLIHEYSIIDKKSKTKEALIFFIYEEFNRYFVTSLLPLLRDFINEFDNSNMKIFNLKSLNNNYMIFEELFKLQEEKFDNKKCRFIMELGRCALAIENSEGFNLFRKQIAEDYLKNIRYESICSSSNIFEYEMEIEECPSCGRLTVSIIYNEHNYIDDEDKYYKELMYAKCVSCGFAVDGATSYFQRIVKSGEKLVSYKE